MLSRTFSREPLILLCAFTLFYILRNVGSAATMPVSIGIAQLFAFPLVLFFFLRLRIFGNTMPRVILIAACIGALLGVGFGYSHKSNPGHSFLVANLNGDEFEIDTRIMRSAIRKELAPNGGIAAVRHFETITSDKHARALLAKEPSLPGLVWGSKRWVTVSLRETDPVPLTQILKMPPKLFESLRVVTSVGVFGLSYEPLEASAGFIASVFSGLLPEVPYSSYGIPANLASQELNLLEAHSFESPWTSAAHRAYPAWLLGNRYLLEAVKGGEFQAGELDCALKSYRSARTRLRYADNPELLAAVLNNEAIAYIIKGLWQDSTEHEVTARNLFSRAAETQTHPNHYKIKYRAAKIARANLRVLNGRRMERLSGKKARKNKIKKLRTKKRKKN